MKLLKGSLLATAAGFAAVAGAQAADLPAAKAAPIEYVRICGTYGAGFFYIPGTDTCLRVSGRARFESGYGRSLYRSNGSAVAGAAGGFGIVNGNQGDTMGYIGLLRLNVDARTQTGYGALRAFLRLDAASRSGATQGLRSGTQERVGRAFGALGQDQAGRLQQYVNVDKAFVQFAGLTAGRASSFFDFYAHDFELQSATAGSDVQSTNLFAYTYTADGGVSATLSVEDPLFRRNTIYAQEGTGSPVNARVLTAIAAGNPTYIGVEVNQRSRMPDFVGVLRLDQSWGSAQLSAAVKELNTGNFVPGTTTAGPAGVVLAGVSPVTQRPPTDYGWAVQGGVKLNLPFIASGDTLYLQAAYGKGATIYTGYSDFDGTYTSQATTINGSAFTPFLSDGTLNPFTGKIQQSESYIAVGSYLHYWTPEWRSAFFGSYGALNFANGARLANYLAYSAPGSVITAQNFIGAVGTPAQGGIFSRSFALSPVLRDTYQYVAGASLIWSPVKDLDIGIEGMYTRINLRSGRVVDQTQGVPVTAAAVNAGAVVKTVSGEDTYQARIRVQRDF